MLDKKQVRENLSNYSKALYFDDIYILELGEKAIGYKKISANYITEWFERVIHLNDSNEQYIMFHYKKYFLKDFKEINI